jgi:outer membrane protein assembly factor BamB
MQLNQSNRLISACFLTACVCGFSCKGSDSGRQANGGTLELVWNTAAQNVFGWPGTAGVAGNTVIFGAHQGLAAFDTESGALRWTAKLWSDDIDAFATNVAIGDGHACVADQLTVGCVDVATGRVLWTKTVSTDSPPGNGESAYDSHTWFYGGRDHKVHAVDPETGTERWSTDITPGAGGPTRVWGVSVRGDTVYATTVRWLTRNSVPLVGDLVALNRQTGAVIWTYTTPGDRGGFQGRALLTDRFAIVNDTYYHALVAIDLQTGKEIWRTVKDESGFISAESTPILAGDTVFAASADTQIYAVDARTGALLWRVRGDGNALGSIDACPKSLIPLEFAGGRPFLVDRKTHQVTSIDALPPGVIISSRFSVVGDRAYAAGTGGVYAFRCR